LRRGKKENGRNWGVKPASHFETISLKIVTPELPVYH